MASRWNPKAATLCVLAGLIIAACGQDEAGPATATVSVTAGYPERPITMIIPWGAGGGTDATGRMMAGLLQAELGQPVIVVNRDGGSGVVGHSAIANATPDGYTIGILTVEIGMMHWVGLTELTGQDYTPIALYNYDPAGLQVRADSEWHTATDLIEAIKANPGKYKSSGTGQGGIWHVAMAGVLSEAGGNPGDAPWVPLQGTAPSLQELISGGVDVVTSSLAEASSLIRAGRIRPLAVMDDKRMSAFPDVPTLKEATGLDWKSAVWRGVAGPKGMPDEATTKLTAAIEKVSSSPEFREFMDNQGFGMIWETGPDFAAYMEESDASLGAVMQAMGLAR